MSVRLFEVGLGVFVLLFGVAYRELLLGSLLPSVVDATGSLHLVAESILGVIAGVLVVVGYLLVLRWLESDTVSSDQDRDSRNRHSEERRSNR